MKVNMDMKKMGLCARLLLCIMLLSGVTAVYAQDSDGGEATEGYDFVEWQSGQRYDVERSKQYYAKFTAPEDGTLVLCYYTMDPMAEFVDPELTTPLSPDPTQIGWAPKTFNIEMKAGTTYYFSSGNWGSMSAGYVTVSFGGEFVLELQNTQPEQGSTLDISSGAQVSLEFNDAVQMGSARLTAGGVSRAVSPNVYISTIIFNLKNDLMTLMNSGMLKAGDEFTLTVTDICRGSDPEQRYGTDGSLTVTFKVGGKPLRLVGTVNTPGEEATSMNTFLSYYSPDAEQNCVKLVFDGDLMKDCAVVTLSYGDLENENGDYYTETITDVTYDGPTLTIPLYGKHRTPVTMVPSGTDYGIITLSINQVRGADGQYVYSSGSGSLGGFGYIYTYQELQPKTLSLDWTPVKGSMLKSGTRLELWVSDDLSGISFDGVSFSYTVGDEAKTVTVAREDLTVESDPEDETASIITLRVPQLSGASDVTLSFVGMTSSDGYDYSDKFVQTYKFDDGTGVATVMEDGMERWEVYTIDGIQVMKTADRADLQSLAPGVYVVNGRKVIVK